VTEQDNAGFLTGSKAIAKALDCSERSVRRAARAGRLPCIKLAAHTSPWRIRRSDLAQFRAGLLPISN
jgi:hypothetical protein